LVVTPYAEVIKARRTCASVQSPMFPGPSSSQFEWLYIYYIIYLYIYHYIYMYIYVISYHIYINNILHFKTHPAICSEVVFSFKSWLRLHWQRGAGQGQGSAWGARSNPLWMKRKTEAQCQSLDRHYGTIITANYHDNIFDNYRGKLLTTI
jgi:hypothetical protein